MPNFYAHVSTQVLVDLTANYGASKHTFSYESLHSNDERKETLTIVMFVCIFYLATNHYYYHCMCGCMLNH